MNKPELLITFPGGKKVDAQFGDRVIHTDQSKQAGGDGSAPEPYALFLASIGTCAGIYVLGFLQSRNLPTEGVQIRQQLDFGRNGLTGVDLQIELPDTIPAKYHQAIARVADMCAVKKAIQAQPDFNVSVKQTETLAA